MSQESAIGTRKYGQILFRVGAIFWQERQDLSSACTLPITGSTVYFTCSKNLWNSLNRLLLRGLFVYGWDYTDNYWHFCKIISIGCDSQSSSLIHALMSVCQHDCLFWVVAFPLSCSVNQHLVYHRSCGPFGFRRPMCDSLSTPSTLRVLDASIALRLED